MASLLLLGPKFENLFGGTILKLDSREQERFMLTATIPPASLNQEMTTNTQTRGSSILRICLFTQETRKDYLPAVALGRIDNGLFIGNPTRWIVAVDFSHQVFALKADHDPLSKQGPILYDEYYDVGINNGLEISHEQRVDDFGFRLQPTDCKPLEGEGGENIMVHLGTLANFPPPPNRKLLNISPLSRLSSP